MGEVLTMEYIDTIECKDKRLYIVSRFSESEKPLLHKQYWSFGPCDAESAARYSGQEIRSLGDGRYSVRVAPFNWVTLALPDGGRTIVDHVDITPIECPKVRKGIETRYWNGRWQKYLKSEGWISL